MTRDLFILLEELREKRTLKVNYDELLMIIEFLFLHDSGFQVTSSNESENSCFVKLL